MSNRSFARRLPYIRPVLADLDIHLQRHVDLYEPDERILHAFGDELRDGGDFFLRRIDDDFVVHLKGEYLDASYLQQDAYHDIDAATPADRQQYVFAAVHRVLKTGMTFPDKNQARSFFQRLVQATNDWNRTAFKSPEFAAGERAIGAMVQQVTKNA